LKKLNVTFSIPQETIDLMHGLIGRRKLSAFVTEALNNALKEKEEELQRAYAEANVDPDRRETVQDWSSIEGEAWDE
jgi:hypothetical protein